MESRRTRITASCGAGFHIDISRKHPLRALHPSHLRFAGRIDTLRRASRPSVRAVGFDGFVIK